MSAEVDRLLKQVRNLGKPGLERDHRFEIIAWILMKGSITNKRAQSVCGYIWPINAAHRMAELREAGLIERKKDSWPAVYILTEYARRGAHL